MQQRKIGDCHQFAPRHDPRNKALSLKRIGWLYPIFQRGGHAGMPIHRVSQRTVRERPWAFAKINGAATVRVCEKTGDCPKRRARARRFINDLQEARGLYPGGFHRPVRERSVPLKSLVLPPASGSPKGIKPSGVFDRAVCERGSIPTPSYRSQSLPLRGIPRTNSNARGMPQLGQRSTKSQISLPEEGAPVPSEVPKWLPTAIPLGSV